MDDKLIYAAPLQGYTDVAWRLAHAGIYGGVDAYFTPFIRVEKGSVRQRDLNNAIQNMPSGIPVIPQIIFGSRDEFIILADTLIDAGATHINLNLGCPFPPQVKHGRGAGALRAALIEEIASIIITRYSFAVFSAKLRLGINSSDEWRPILNILNTIPLDHITLHPRIAAQQYVGECNSEIFDEFLASTSHRVVYNGDIRSVSDIARIGSVHNISGDVMVGRGLLSRPSLALEYRSNEEWCHDKRVSVLRRFHEEIYSTYMTVLCGDQQILQKIKPMWDWLEDEIGHKAWKAIHKATTLRKYESAVADALS